jgi:N-formylglutamate deformylase
VLPEEDAAIGKSHWQDGVSAPNHRGFFNAPGRGIMPSVVNVFDPLWDVLEGDPKSNLVLHVPHGGLFIPEGEVGTFALENDELTSESLLMADFATDILARRTYETAPVKPWVFINKLSRLVVDPERFTDDSEEMNAVGMGFAYTLTSDQRELRTVSASESNRLRKTYFQPYTDAFQQLVGKVLEDRGSVKIIDLHSYAVEPLLYELHKADERPGLCIGTDSFHTRDDFLAAARLAFGSFTSVGLNQPFSGTYVPLEFYGTDARIQSLMLEIRKDTYGFGVEVSGAFEQTVQALVRLVGELYAV